MIFISLQGLFKEKYFENKINKFDFIKLVRYYFPSIEPTFGFSKKRYYTVITNLNFTIEEIFLQFKKSTKYKINRGKREGIVFEIENNIDIFFHYYNEFAKSKNFELLEYSTLLKYKKEMIITKAIYENNILVMHVHIYNDDIAMLMFSASHFRNIAESKNKNIISYANLLLHYEDMIFFKRQGCKTYDFGGYAYETEDKSLQGINQFKELFNPILVERKIYTSWLLNLILYVKRVVSLIGFKIKKL